MLYNPRSDCARLEVTCTRLSTPVLTASSDHPDSATMTHQKLDKSLL
jgi:hypothetical protein